MPRLFAADAKIVREHCLQNIAIADTRRTRIDVVLLGKFEQTKIAHNSCNKRIVFQLSLFL